MTRIPRVPTFVLTLLFAALGFTSTAFAQGNQTPRTPTTDAVSETSPRYVPAGLEASVSLEVLGPNRVNDVLCVVGQFSRGSFDTTPTIRTQVRECSRFVRENFGTTLQMVWLGQTSPEEWFAGANEADSPLHDTQTATREMPLSDDRAEVITHRFVGLGWPAGQIESPGSIAGENMKVAVLFRIRPGTSTADLQADLSALRDTTVALRGDLDDTREIVALHGERLTALEAQVVDPTLEASFSFLPLPTLVRLTATTSDTVCNDKEMTHRWVVNDQSFEGPTTDVHVDRSIDQNLIVQLTSSCGELEDTDETTVNVPALSSSDDDRRVQTNNLVEESAFGIGFAPLPVPTLEGRVTLAAQDARTALLIALGGGIDKEVVTCKDCNNVPQELPMNNLHVLVGPVRRFNELLSGFALAGAQARWCDQGKDVLPMGEAGLRFHAGSVSVDAAVRGRYDLRDSTFGFTPLVGLGIEL